MAKIVKFPRANTTKPPKKKKRRLSEAEIERLVLNKFKDRIITDRHGRTFLVDTRGKEIVTK